MTIKKAIGGRAHTPPPQPAQAHDWAVAAGADHPHSSPSPLLFLGFPWTTTTTIPSHRPMSPPPSARTRSDRPSRVPSRQTPPRPGKAATVEPQNLRRRRPNRPAKRH